MQRKQLERSCQVMAEPRIGCLRIMLGFQLSFINANEFLSFSSFLTETVVGNPVKPGRKTRLSAEASEVLINTQKCLLRKIVRKREIAPNELAEHPSHTRLVISHQLGKSVVVIIDKNASDEVCIG